MSTEAGGTDHLFLFTYANHLLWDMVFVLIFSIYLFIYSKRCQQKQVEPTTCFYLLMQIACWLHVLFVLIFIIYFFIYSKRYQQKQVELTTCFYYASSFLCTLQAYQPSLIFSINAWNFFFHPFSRPIKQ